MATLADSLVSSSARMLPIRVRPDLTAQQQRYQGRVYWVVKDPVGLQYYRFQEEEYAILRMLDGETSLDDLKEQFEDEFPPQKITVEELGQFIGQLHRSGLVIADVPGQGRQLKKRRDERKRKELLGALSNILAVRFKGIDPERLLNWLYPKVRFFFRPWAVGLWVVLALSALTLVAVNFDRFHSMLPGFHEFFRGRNWLWLGIALAVTKVIHEFGHGLSCKHFGGECHEMGVMLLVLTPCLYCNVSDSWMLPNKWHRAWIGAAGMYIEIFIASIATWIWWLSWSTEPGTLNQICLSTMFVCSVSTVVFNANPLLRYDGYYILSDLTEIPNLRQKASTILSRKLGAWCLGLEEPHDPFLPQRNQIFFALYSIGAAIYRWLVLFSILWFLYKVFEPYGLKVISQTITFVAVAGLIVQPIWKLGKFFYIPGRIEQVKRVRLQATLAILATVAAAILVIPLPYRVMCTLEVKPRDAEPVYVDVPGILQKVNVKAGDQVAANAELAQLQSVDLQLQLKELEGRLAENEAERRGLEHTRYERQISTDRTAGAQIKAILEAIAAIKNQIAEKKLDEQRLTLKAPIAGIVLPPPSVPRRPEGPGRLESWSGTPLEPKNLGAFLPESVLFCQIGNPKKMEAHLVIEQDYIDDVAEGDPVDIKLDVLPGTTFHSKIDEIGFQMKVAPKQLSNKAGGDMITKTDEVTGIERPVNTSFPARAALDDEEGVLAVGLRGQAKIHAHWRTLGWRFWRYFIRTFNFKL